MKVADLATASTIAKRLGEINRDRCALVLNINSAGIRIKDSAATWIGAKQPETMRSIARLLDVELAAEEASLRRRAAQIGLSL